jgi:glucose-6-phosphate 1-epimerase
MPDFGDDEYPHMLCVESGNVRGDAVTLAPGASVVLSVTIESESLK